MNDILDRALAQLDDELTQNWLNDQAATVSLPKGILARASPIQKWKSIKASTVSRNDLIKMKASAFSIRRDQTNKDWEDLVLLKPTPEEIAEAIMLMQPTAAEINEAILFIKESNFPPLDASKQILNEFEESLRDLRKIPK